MEFVWYITKKSHLHIDSIGVGYNFSICLVIEFEHNESTNQPTDQATIQSNHVIPTPIFTYESHARIRVKLNIA